MSTSERGFTLPELLVTGFLILLLLGAGTLFAHVRDYGPATRNAERWTAAAQIVQLLSRYQRDHGTLPEVLPHEEEPIGSESGMIDLCPALAPAYTKTLPIDVAARDTAATEITCSEITEDNTYITGLSIVYKDNTLTVAAPLAENGQDIRVSRKF